MFHDPIRDSFKGDLNSANPQVCLGCELAPACPLVFPQCVGHNPDATGLAAAKPVAAAARSTPGRRWWPGRSRSQ